VINQEQSAKVAGEASEALGVFERLKSSAGPISSALNRAADRVEAGEAEGIVRKELERDVFQAVQAELEAVGLRKRPRADSLEARLDALRKKCSTGGLAAAAPASACGRNAAPLPAAPSGRSA
jgi:phage shock protein A